MGAFIKENQLCLGYGVGEEVDVRGIGYKAVHLAPKDDDGEGRRRKGGSREVGRRGGVFRIGGRRGYSIETGWGDFVVFHT